MKTLVLPGLILYWYVEVDVLEFYGRYPLPCLKGVPYCFWSFNFKFVQRTEVQDRSPTDWFDARFHEPGNRLSLSFAIVVKTKSDKCPIVLAIH